MTKPLTKSAKAQLAKQARRYGYFSNQFGLCVRFAADGHHGATLWVICPLCKTRIETIFSQYEHGNSIIKTLDAAVIDHLTHDEQHDETALTAWPDDAR